MKRRKEPKKRYLHRLGCNQMSMGGHCYQKSGWLTECSHITMGCDGCCPRMEEYDKANGYEDVEFTKLYDES